MKSAVMGVLLVCATGTALADWVRIRSDGTVTVLAARLLASSIGTLSTSTSSSASWQKSHARSDQDE